MSFDMNPADEDPHGECRHEICALRDCLVNLLKSRDASWDDGEHGGHDWPEAIAAAERIFPEISDHKYINAECLISGCQWLVAEHQLDVYREQMAKAECECEANKNAATYWWTRFYGVTGQERPKAFDSATEEFAASHEALIKERDALLSSLQAVDREWQSLKDAVKASSFRAVTIGGKLTLISRQEQNQ